MASENVLELVKTPACTNKCFILNLEKMRLSNESKAGRTRTVYTEQQVTTLQAAFEEDNDPSMERIEELAKSIKLTEQQVCSSMQTYWFILT